MLERILLLLLLFPLTAISQELPIKKDYSGVFSLGGRTTISAFNSHDGEGTGLGVGGQFRIQFADRVNSDWFFDYLNSDIGDFAQRTDYHIGWSVLFYPTINQKALIRPYILAGHCFDYTKIVANNDRSNSTDRFSSAVQGGAGFHVNLTDQLDLSFAGQYMLHLGKEIHADVHNGEVHFLEMHHRSFEGHLLFHVGVNYKIADLW